MKDKTVGVLAATPADTRMGVEFAQERGFSVSGSRYISKTPTEQTKLQVMHKDELTKIVLGLCGELCAEGAGQILIYCNSLSAAIDLSAVRAGCDVRVITPLDAYVELAAQYKSLAVLAANGQSLAAIERTLHSANPDCFVYGCGLLPLVEAVENQQPPEEIVQTLALDALANSMGRMGAEALVLGCTHFPYFAEDLQQCSPLPLLDPADEIAKLLAKPL